jgi:protein SDA1
MQLINSQVEHNAKLRRDNEGKASESTPLFPAIQLIHDPQALAEKLFKKLRQPGEKFEVKLLLMNFISRLIGCHKLILLSFYSFLQRYITSHQKDVTHILAYLIQVLSYSLIYSYLLNFLPIYLPAFLLAYLISD